MLHLPRLFNFKARIVFACVLPMLGMIALSAYLMVSTLRESATMAALVRLTTLAPTISALVHELQKERGTSAGFLGSGGQGAFAERLAEQRRQTDLRLAEFAAAMDGFPTAEYGPSFTAKTQAARVALAGMERMRGDIHSLSAKVDGVAAFYGSSIARLLEMIDEMTEQSDSGHLAARITAYTALLKAKERAGVERAMGSNGFSAGRFDPGIYRRFLELKGQQDAYAELFLAHASDTARDAFRRILSTPAANEVERMRAIAADSPFLATTQDVKGEHWFNAATDRINMMKAVEDGTAADVLVLAKESQAGSNTHAVTVAGVVVAMLLITAAMIAFTVRALVRPLAMVTAGIEGVAAGNLDIAVPPATSQDEIGALSRALGVFKEAALEQQRMAERERQHNVAREHRTRALEAMIARFEAESAEALRCVTSAAAELQETAGGMSATAEEASRQASAVAAAAEQTSANVQTVAAASDEMSASIEEIARQIARSSAMTQDAEREAMRVNRKVEGLEAVARDIGEVVHLISDIASRTSLLALNASIEAARAGDAGKGFAVVANEVKSLASKTGQATEQISRHIAEVQAATAETVSAVHGIGAAIRNINAAAAAIGAAMEEQGAATREIVRSIDQASVGTREVSANIAGVNRASQDAGAAASQVLSASAKLAHQSAAMRNSVDDFLAGIRSA